MVNMSRLSNKVAIVTGRIQRHSGGIATALGAAGARVAVNYSSDREGAETRRSGRSQTTGASDRGRGRRVQGRRCCAVIQRSGFRVRKTGRFGQQRGVFRFGTFAEITEESFHLHYNINVLGAILTVQEAIKRFGADGGSIINLSSIVGSHPVAGVLLLTLHESTIENADQGIGASNYAAQDTCPTPSLPVIQKTEGK